MLLIYIFLRLARVQKDQPTFSRSIVHTLLKLIPSLSLSLYYVSNSETDNSASANRVLDCQRIAANVCNNCLDLYLYMNAPKNQYHTIVCVHYTLMCIESEYECMTHVLIGLDAQQTNKSTSLALVRWMNIGETTQSDTDCVAIYE